MATHARRAFAALVAPIGGSVALCAAKSSWPDMNLPERASVHADGSVDALLNYQASHVTLVRTRRDAGGSDATLDGADWEPHPVLMRDGRRETTPLTLDRNGFELMEDKRDSHVCYYDEQAVIGPYYRECERLLQRVTGAKFVAAFDHNVRCDTAKATGRRLVGGNLVQAPAGLVHGDYTKDSAPRRFALLGQPPKLNDALRPILGDRPLVNAALVDEALSGQRRYALINIWRPISTVEQKPLACADAASVSAKDLVVFQIVYADRVGENYFAKWSAAHRWFYFPTMTRDEVLLIKQWDSEGDLVSASSGAGSGAEGASRGAGTGTSTFALHTAFKDPSSAPTAPDRESIEVRLVCVF